MRRQLWLRLWYSSTHLRIRHSVGRVNLLNTSDSRGEDFDMHRSQEWPKVAIASAGKVWVMKERALPVEEQKGIQWLPF